MLGQIELEQQKGGLKQPSIFLVSKQKRASFKVKLQFEGDKLLNTSLLCDLHPSCFASRKILSSHIAITPFHLYFGEEKGSVLRLSRRSGLHTAVIRLFASPSTSTLCCSPLISFLTIRQQENHINFWCQTEQGTFICEEIS